MGKLLKHINLKTNQFVILSMIRNNNRITNYAPFSLAKLVSPFRPLGPGKPLRPANPFKATRYGQV